jgi:uncharacterized UBP type Zn finger protein
MSDAGELLLVLFEHMKGVAPAVAGAAVDAVFGLRVAEAVACHMCGRETQQSSYTQVCRGVHLFQTFPNKVYTKYHVKLPLSAVLFQCLCCCAALLAGGWARPRLWRPPAPH